METFSNQDMNNIIFSVIIPYKGRFGFVKDAINSVLNQDGVEKESVEILAIDDLAREKGTQKKLKKLFPLVRYLNNEDKEGPGGKRNTGLKYARGEYIVFLDSDDQLQRNFLSVMQKALERTKNAGGAICLSDKLFEKGFPFKEKLLRLLLSDVQDLGFVLGYTFNNGNLYKSSFYLSQLSHMMFKRGAVGQIRFNYDYRKGGEDWDFCFRVLEKLSIKIILKRLIVFRYSWGSSTYTPEMMKLKWRSYSLLMSRLPVKTKRSVFYRLLKFYINFFKK